MEFSRSFLQAVLALLALSRSAAAASNKPAGPDPDDIENWRLLRAMVWTWVVLLTLLMGWCFSHHVSVYIRTVGAVGHGNQRYFGIPSDFYGKSKRYLLDAPLFRQRHHREFKLSNAINIGTLPSRLQTLFLTAYLVMSITLTTYNIKWDGGKDKILDQILKRTGFMAIINMLPLFLFAGRNNPLIVWTGITFDTYNLIHRWLGRICVLEAIVHGTVWVVHKVQKSGWAAVAKSEKYSSFILSGTIAACAFTAILFQSPSVFRHAFYETFLHTHQALAALALGAVWVHLDHFPKQKNLMKGVLAIWAIERGIRVLRILYRNVGNGGTRAEVQALPGDAVRITVRLARPWRFETGAHAYLYMPRIGLWMSHPFSLAWSQDEDSIEFEEKEKPLPMTNQDILEKKKTYMSFIVRRRTGFTDKLFRKAANSPDGRFTTTCFAEGPYGSQKLHSYGTVLLFAAGVGITHQVPHVRDLVTGYGNGTVAARKVVLIWIIQSPEHLEWIRPWMTTILSLPKRREVLKVLLFVTRPRNSKEIYSPSSSVQMFPGKPNIPALVDSEVEQSIGAVGVSVCGVGALADDVRKACRRWMDTVALDFAEESFSW